MRPARGRDTAVLDALRAIGMLARGPCLVEELAGELGLTRRTAYRLLEVLAEAGLEVERHREGRCVYLRMRRLPVLAALGLG